MTRADQERIITEMCANLKDYLISGLSLSPHEISYWGVLESWDENQLLRWFVDNARREIFDRYVLGEDEDSADPTPYD